MPTSREFVLLDLNKIIVDRDNRQRRTLSDIETLAESIRRIGLINPIVVTREFKLVAGERRLEAFRSIPGTKSIPAQFLDELDSYELQAIELEENIKRSALSWQDEARAIENYHQSRLNSDPDWEASKTAGLLGLSPSWISKMISISRELRSGNKIVSQAVGPDAAYNAIKRQDNRAIETQLSQLEDNIAETLAPAHVPAIAPAFPKPLEIWRADFTEWAPTYEGRKFNFLHCDFPYGINHDKSDQGGSSRHVMYADTPDIYWGLCRSLCQNLDRILFPSAHVIFWFSMNYYQETVDFFHDNSDLIVNPFPLIWLKSDGRGIVPDAQRGPRRVYETALLMARGDRKVIKPVANAYAAPTASRSDVPHVSEKPEPVLRHFFSMVVDELTELLDPTCGSGGALPAAESLGARRVVGLDLSPEHVETSRARLVRFRSLAKAEETVNE